MADLPTEPEHTQQHAQVSYSDENQQAVVLQANPACVPVPTWSHDGCHAQSTQQTTQHNDSTSAHTDTGMLVQGMVHQTAILPMEYVVHRSGFSASPHASRAEQPRHITRTAAGMRTLLHQLWATRYTRHYDAYNAAAHMVIMCGLTVSRFLLIHVCLCSRVCAMARRAATFRVHWTWQEWAIRTWTLLHMQDEMIVYMYVCLYQLIMCREVLHACRILVHSCPRAHTVHSTHGKHYTCQHATSTQPTGTSYPSLTCSEAYFPWSSCR